MSLRAEQLVCRRGEATVFRDLSFELAPGGAMLLVGPNGSGKSSLLRLCAGLIPMAGGHLRLGDADLAEDGEAFRGRVAYVGHLDAIKAAFSVGENLAFWAELAGGARSIEAALEALGIARLRDVPARYLSAGQKRRACLARLALSDAPLWLLDEPAVSLDVDGTALLGRLIGEHRSRGGMVMAATHGDIAIEGAATLGLGARP